MPFGPEEEAIIERLALLHRETEASILRQIADAATSDRARARLRVLLNQVDRTMAGLTQGTRTWIANDLPALYALGATRAGATLGTPFAWTHVHAEAVEALARATWADVAPHLQDMTASTRVAIRSLLDDNVRRQILEGVPGRQASRQLAAALQSETGAATVTYANGARHGMADYADTLARTSAATVRNAGTFGQSRAEGITYMECFDGADCGLEAHNAPPLANGLVLPIEQAEEFPVSHPRCARSWSPRPDVRTPGEADDGRRFDADEQERMAAEERARAATALVDGRPRGTFAARPARTPRAPRAPRAPRPARTPRVPVTASTD